jgi:hypothetical protein
MAKFQPILGNLAGSEAGLTWSTSRGGAQIRRRAKSTSRDTARQQVVRARLNQCSRRWVEITQLQRDHWEQWAELHPVVDSLGQHVALTGQQAFCQLNALRLQMQATIRATPPIGPGPNPLASASFTFNSATHVQITFAPSPLPAGTRLYVRSCMPGSAGRAPNLAAARFGSISASAATSSVALPLRFPASVGQTVVMFLSTIDNVTGQLSVPIRVEATR